ncbi:MAG TPA: STAS domain-containing protein [Solirubrobacterales bacterium]|nr:STAS domain-containing protein [Solirubrobacterales bacterium]
MAIATTETRDGLLTVRQADEGDVIRLSLCGELDLSNAKTLETSLQQILASGSHALVDLGKLEFLDSTGINLLVLAMKDQEAGRLTFLPSESPAVCRLLSLTGLDERLGLNSPQPPAPA